MTESILKEMVKAGILGAVLAWALWENSRMVERLFQAIERNTAALIRVEQYLSGTAPGLSQK